MKKLTTLFLTFFVLLNSCSSDDDSSNHASIVGKWAFNSTSINNGTPIPYDDHEVCGKDYLEFKSNNTYMEVDVWDCELDIVDYGTYTKNNNQLVIISEDFTMNAEILELTNTTLTIKMNVDFDDNGTTDVVIADFDRI
jgi:hypothetical protein